MNYNTKWYYCPYCAGEGYVVEFYASSPIQIEPSERVVECEFCGGLGEVELTDEEARQFERENLELVEVE